MPETGRASLSDRLTSMAVCCAVVAAICTGGASVEASAQITSVPRHSYRATDLETLRERFSQPPGEAGPWVYWMWFDNVVSKAEITRELEEMAAAGIAGAELRCLVARGFPGLTEPWYGPDSWARLGHQRLKYLSPEFVDALAHTCAEAERCGVKLATNLGMGWPPGGPWITNEHRSKHLQAASRIVAGPKPLALGAVTVPADAMAFAWKIDTAAKGNRVMPQSFRDLTGNVDAEHQLSWDVPEGKWLIGIFHCTYGGICDKGNGPEADPGSREAVLFHLDHIFSRLDPTLGKYYGTTLVEIASDSWEYTRPRTGRYWSPALFDVYSACTGSPLKPRMYALLGYGPKRETILSGLDEAGREAIQKNFYKTVTGYLHQRGLKHRPQVRGRGLPRDFFDSYAAADVPEIEEEVYLPEAVWTAHTLGKPIVSAEAFTFLSRYRNNLTRDTRPHHGALDDPARKWETTPALMRQHANAHFARGINRIQIHSFSYSPPGVPPPGWRMYAEIHLNRNVPWWSAMPEFSRWVARNQLVLQSGGPVADAVVYPVIVNPPDGPFNAAIDQPISALDAVDGANRTNFGHVKRLTGDVPYDFPKLILLEDIRTLAEARHIVDLIQDGIVVVCCKTMPAKWAALADGHDSAPVGLLLDTLNEAIDRGRIVDARADGPKAALSASRSIRWLPSDASLSYQHRRVDGGEIYFLMNWGGDFDGEVDFPHKGLVPEFWDAETGTTKLAGQYAQDNGRTRVRVSLCRLDSTFVVFSERDRPLHAVACHNGRVETDSQGSLYAIPTDERPCRVDMSDGTQLTFEASAPSPPPILGPWNLNTDAKNGVGLNDPVSLELERLVSWRDIPALRSFAGTATYSTQFVVAEEHLKQNVQLRLDLGRVHEVAVIWINDRLVSTTWHPPYRLDITGYARAGANELRVEVANILKNHLERAGSYTRPSGLIGPVQILTCARFKLSEYRRAP